MKDRQTQTTADRDRASRFVPWLVFIGALFIFTTRMRSEFLMIDTRFALFVHEMRETGVVFWPTLYGRAYPDYTGFSTFLSLLAAELTGKVDYFSLVLPSAAAGALLTALTWQTGVRLFNRAIAAAAVLLMFCSLEFVGICRISSVDLYPALATLSAFYVTVVGVREKHERRVFLTLLLLAAGYAFRGPIGLVVPAAVVCGTLLVERRYALMVRFAVCAGLLLAVLAAAWGLVIYKFGGEELLRETFFMQVTHRMSKGKPPWYYFTNAAGSFALTYPVSLGVIVLYAAVFRKKLLAPGPLRAFADCAAYLLVVVLGFSIPGTKHLRYITPAIPAAALLAAHLVWNPQRLGLLRKVRKLFFFLAAICPWPAVPFFLGTQLVLMHPAVAEKTGGVIRLPLLPGTFLLVLLCLLVVFSGRLGRYRRLALLAVVAGLVTFVRIMIIEPVEAATLSSRDFTLRCEKIRGDRLLTFFALGPDGDENKYMVNIRRSRAFVPRYVNDDDLDELPPDSLVVARMDKWKRGAGEWTILARGRIGRRYCALLTKKARHSRP
ncbi:MAG: glycosyltransferase family 39 protein [Lentisphaeria bacterium]|nr:glycosyltransferase family 39 protein [Lentisphaeria bacterium]